jgi:glycosyltransferase involved in cell wall biosynthesis
MDAGPALGLSSGLSAAGGSAEAAAGSRGIVTAVMLGGCGAGTRITPLVAEVVHISPLLFGEEGVYGGGERYVLELARAMAPMLPTRLVTFGASPRRFHDGALEVVVLRRRGRLGGNELNPISERLFGELRSARVVHVHQYETLLSNICLVAARALRTPAFVTDLGGGGHNFVRVLRLHRLVTGALAISRFSADFYPELRDRTEVIYGGVDARRFSPGGGERRAGVVFVGRLLPHKGVDVLIEAMPPDVPLHVYGRAYDSAYRAELERLARGKQVHFHEQAADEEIVAAYRSARAAVLPSVYTSRYGVEAAKPELLGLTPLEAGACGTPAVVSSAGSLPEVVEDGVTGFVVAPGDSEALGARLRELLEGGPAWEAMSAAAAERVRAEFTWERVAERCVAAYARRATRRAA